jgi:SAM-dependent methyltransferase
MCRAEAEDWARWAYCWACRGDTIAGMSSTPPGQLDRTAFDAVYEQVIIGNNFFELPTYYREHQPRYRRTIEHVARLGLPAGSNMLDIGGGQIALLCSKLFGHSAMLADVNSQYADAVTRFGLRFAQCDLLHDDLPERDHFDLVVMCEVIEHFPVPPHIVLSRIRRWIKPGGFILLTTPNLYRIRNSLRLLTGRRVFSRYFYPAAGQSIGHPIEYSGDHLAWHLEQGGFDVRYVAKQQLTNVGSSILTRLARLAITPIQMVPMWRDSLVAVGQKPTDPGARKPRDWFVPRALQREGSP